MRMRSFVRGVSPARAWLALAVAVAFQFPSKAPAGADDTVSLLPASQTVAIGEQVSVELWWNFRFDPPSVGGNDVFYDATKLRFVSYTWNPLAGDSFFQRDPDLRRSELNGIGAGAWFCSMAPEIRIGTIVFEAIAAGSVELTVANNDAPVGPLVDCYGNPYPATMNGASITIYANTDTDGDGITDSEDNCTTVFNVSQYDSNGDDIGNACDPDISGSIGLEDCLVNFFDLLALEAAFFSTPTSARWNPHADFDGNGAVNFSDLQVLKTHFFGPPGPSAAGCN